MGDPNSSAHTPGIPEASKGFQFLAAKYYGHISGVSMSRNGFSGVISASHTPVVLNTEQFYPLGGHQTMSGDNSDCDDWGGDALGI